MELEIRWADGTVISELLIAAKSIIRFSEKDTSKTEYVLAGMMVIAAKA